MLQECLKGELRVVNAHLPSKQKPLSDLLGEEYPHVLCNDGSVHLFSRKELKYLASLIDTDEQKALLLPILIEVSAGQGEMAIICPGEVEEKVISKVLDMPLTPRQKKVMIYKPQLAIVRKLLRTTTQYLFPPKL
ncbi:MAG: DUF61 family protein [Dehalococcoidia bacterium]|nr:MAG: DUF61 family protein [Dehalococcoidia bacterium]